MWNPSTGWNTKFLINALNITLNSFKATLFPIQDLAPVKKGIKFDLNSSLGFNHLFGSKSSAVGPQIEGNLWSALIEMRNKVFYYTKINTHIYINENKIKNWYKI
jgi:hypothetical protein